MRRERIIVALSGGVDSAVAAALLLKEGYDVEGVYLKYASETVRDFVNTTECSWEEDLAAASAVGKHLGIPVRSLNVERAYNDRVIRTFIHEYATGRTPNPDIICNRDIKFGLFLQWARDQGVQQIATGHYARIGRRNGTYQLLSGVDPDKDQSYFLYAIPPAVLSCIRFPVGSLTKREVRILARSFGLPNAERRDSQGVCFVGDLNVRAFLRVHIAESPGPIVTSDGTVVGTHTGLSLFTIGQRHGIGIGGGIPYYVTAKNYATRTLVVARGRNDPTLHNTALIAKNPTWSSEIRPLHSFRCHSRIRYRQPLVPSTVYLDDEHTLIVHFDAPQRAITPGQAIVFYDGNTVLGGATIEHTLDLSSTLPLVNTLQ